MQPIWRSFLEKFAVVLDTVEAQHLRNVWNPLSC
jgi:hypothetical protein